MADLPSIVESLHQLDAQWSALARQGADIDLIVSFWSEDAQLIPPKAKPIIGRDAIREFVSTSLAIPGFSISWKTESFTVAPSGDFAYGVAKNWVTVPGPEGETITIPGQAVTVWRKDAEDWKCVVDIWNEAAE